jgi:hypothetical protein
MGMEGHHRRHAAEPTRAAWQDSRVTVELVYCEGWDPAASSIVRPLPEATARERDSTGDQYAFLLGGHRPLALVEVCWTANHAAAWRFDDQGRRDRLLELRRWPDGRLRLRAARQWAYNPGTPEFHGDEPRWRASYWSATYDRDGKPQESSTNWSGAGPRFETSWAVPGFGDWSAVVGELLGASVTTRLAPDPHPVADPPMSAPWHPPVPLRPVHLDETFEAGTRFALDGAELTVKLAVGGKLALPSGRLIVADPDPWMTEVPQFVEVVAPGTYPVRLSVVQFADEPDHARVAAVAVEVSGSPTVSWDTAWRNGEDELLLGDGEFFGVAVDGGRVALVDASAAAVHADAVEAHYAAMSGFTHEITSPAANLISVESGWGDGLYPVWVGRDAGGRVTRFVVDFLVLAHARVLD